MNKRPPAAYLVLIWRFLIMQENKQEKKWKRCVSTANEKKSEQIWPDCRILFHWKFLCLLKWLEGYLFFYMLVNAFIEFYKILRK